MIRPLKNKTSIFALAIIGAMTMSLVPASAATTVRDHREKPIVRDHRPGAPVVRDQRATPARGGSTVTESTRPRGGTPKCLGNLCNIKEVCVGPACF